MGVGQTSSGEDLSRNVYDNTGLQQSTNLTNRLISMLMPPGLGWGEVEISEKSMDLKKLLQEYTKNTADVIEDSNLYKECQAYVRNLTIGTGCIRLLYTGNEKRPIRFKHVPLNNLLFTEDGNGRPNYVFYNEMDMSADRIGHVWGADAKPDWELTTKKNIRENVIFEADSDGEGGKYHYFVCTDGYEEFFHYDVMDRNPFIITRWDKLPNNSSWGFGPALQCLSHMINANDGVYQKKIAGLLSIRPPLLGYGEATVFQNLSFVPGRVSFMGADGQNRVMPLQTSINPQIEYYAVEEDRQAIQESFYSDYISRMPETGVRTATEWTLRYREFMEVFSPNYGRLETEMLEPIFMGVYGILLDINYKEMSREKLSDKKVMVNFQNKLTENDNANEIESITNFYVSMSQLVGADMVQANVKIAEFFERMSDLYGIDKELLYKKEEAQQRTAQAEQYREQIKAQAEMQQGGQL